MVNYEYDSYYRPIKWCEDWKEFDDEHRDDLFHWHVGIQERVCSLIIDQNALGEFVSKEVIEKLHLPVIEHPHPYTLPWFVAGGEFKVTKQALISFQFGTFSCEALCDVVPMRIHHLFLGNVWLQQWRAEYHVKRRRIYLHVNGKRLCFVSLTQRETFDMQREKELRLSAIGDLKISYEEFPCLIVEEVVQKDEPLVDVSVDHIECVVSSEVVDDVHEASTVEMTIEHDEPQMTTSASPLICVAPQVSSQVHDPFVGELDSVAKSAESIEHLKELEAHHIYHEPFLLHCTSLDFIIADFYGVPIHLYKRMMTELFTSLLLMVVIHYVGLLAYFRPRFLFDPGGFEDESFRRERE